MIRVMVPEDSHQLTLRVYMDYFIVSGIRHWRLVPHGTFLRIGAIQ